MKLIEVARGWYYFVASSLLTRQLMETRLEVCDVCPEKVQLSDTGMAIVQAVNHSSSLYKCRICNCPLAPKTANPKEQCPLKKW